MANSLTAFNPEYWEAEMQPIFHKENKLMAIAKVDINPLVNDGDTINKPYRSNMSLQTYTKGTDITLEDITGTNEQLTVDTFQAIGFYVDDIDKEQNKWDLAATHAQDMQRLQNNYLEQQMMSLYSSANSTIVASDMGESGSGTYVSSTANIINMLLAAKRKLTALSIPTQNLFAVLGPRDIELLGLYDSGRETRLGDKTELNGFAGNRAGFDIFESTNVPFTATWTPANNPSEGDTVTIAGTTFTFNATPSGSGSVNIGGSTATSIDNLVACINKSGTAGTDYIALSLTTNDRKNMVKNGVVATDGTTNMTIVAYGDIVVSSSTADEWSAETSYPLFGMKKAIRFVAQIPPRVKFQDAQLRFGKYVLSLSGHGKKVWNQNKDALVYATQNASNWT
jgi:hypothetical protein